MKSHVHISILSTCLALLAVALLPSPVGAQTGQGTLIEKFFHHDGYLRRYKVYVPAAYDGQEAWPLVISFHGQVQTIDEPSYPTLDGMRAVADTAHYLLAYPQGLNTPQPEYPGTPGWNVHGGFGDWDDVEFTSRLIDHVSASYNVDPTRIHATGFSHGSAMSFALACRLSDRIASIAGVSGPLPDVYFSNCDTERIFSVLLFHGTADPIHPIEGYTPGSYMATPVPETPLFWANHNNCSLEPTTTDLPDVNAQDSSTVTLIEYPDCDDDAEVEFYRVAGGGHAWPGRPGRGAGNANLDIDASSIIWDFFKRHPHPAPADDYYYLDSQAKVDGFSESVTEVPHYLWIGNSTDIADLSPLSTIASIAGELQISRNDVLTDLGGLASLKTIGGDVYIIYNTLLSKVDGLNSLNAVIGNLLFLKNPSLKILDGFFSLDSVDGTLSISNNDSLRDLTGLNSLASVGGDLKITGNDQLTRTLNGLAGTTIGGNLIVESNNGLNHLALQVTTVDGDVSITGNDALISLDLSALTSIGHDLEIQQNPQLTGLDGLSGLTQIGGNLWVEGNELLQSCSCGLYSCANNGGVAGKIRMTRNAQTGDCNNNGDDLVANACEVGSAIGEVGGDLPTRFALHGAYPNPFKPSTTISYDVPKASVVTLVVFDAVGRTVEEFGTRLRPSGYAGQAWHAAPGRHSVTWDASGLPSGVYFYRLEAGEFVQTRSMILAK